MSLRFVLRRVAVLGALATSLAFAACSDSGPVNPDPHADVQSVLVEVTGGGSVTFNRQHVASGDLTIGDNAVVAVTFRDANGEEDAIAQNPGNFELRVKYLPGIPPALPSPPAPPIRSPAPSPVLRQRRRR